MDKLILTPPVTFVIILIATLCFSYILSVFSFKRKDRSEDAGKAYSCGEEMSDNVIQPDYAQFFPFAFFFTILHVVALMVATAPIKSIGTFVIAIIYIIGAVTSLFILFRRG